MFPFVFQFQSQCLRHHEKPDDIMHAITTSQLKIMNGKRERLPMWMGPLNLYKSWRQWDSLPFPRNTDYVHFIPDLNKYVGKETIDNFLRVFSSLKP